MNKVLFCCGAFFLYFSYLGWTIASAPDDLQLSLDIPRCKSATGAALPDKYYEAAKVWEEYDWVQDVKPDDFIAGGSGLERVDGSKMYDWLEFSKIDLNDDNLCDWFVVSSAPYSTGGDSGTLNTIYLGYSSEWKRVGASMPDDRPDELGFGNSSNEQSQFAFSSEALLIVYDQKDPKSYFIGRFNDRAYTGRSDQRGYHIYVWDAERDTLEELDKWESGSTAAQVYGWFKEHGAVDPTVIGSGRLVEFRPDEEKWELSFGCRDEDLITLSPGFAAKCESMALTD